MGIAAQVICAGAEKTPATAGEFKELTPAAGDSLTVANFTAGTPAYLEDLWVAGSAGVPSVRVRSPRMHDDAQGIRLVAPVANEPLLPFGVDQLLYPGDTLTVEGADSEAEKAVLAALLLYYTDLPGIAARLGQWAEIEPRIKNITGVEITELVSGVRTWGVGKSIIANFDTLKSGLDYAILGYTTNLNTGAVRIVGPDTGNYGIGGPSPLISRMTSTWFVDLSIKTGRAYIPIIASNNAGATLVSCAGVAEVKPKITLILAELG